MSKRNWNALIYDVQKGSMSQTQLDLLTDFAANIAFTHFPKNSFAHEEATDKALDKILRVQQSLNPQGQKPEAYFYQIMRNEIIDYIRNQKVKPATASIKELLKIGILIVEEDGIGNESINQLDGWQILEYPNKPRRRNHPHILIPKSLRDLRGYYSMHGQGHIFSSSKALIDAIPGDKEREVIKEYVNGFGPAIIARTTGMAKPNVSRTIKKWFEKWH